MDSLENKSAARFRLFTRSPPLVFAVCAAMGHSLAGAQFLAVIRSDDKRGEGDVAIAEHAPSGLAHAFRPPVSRTLIGRLWAGSVASLLAAAMAQYCHASLFPVNASRVGQRRFRFFATTRLRAFRFGFGRFGFVAELRDCWDLRLEARGVGALEQLAPSVARRRVHAGAGSVPRWCGRDRAGASRVRLHEA